MHRIAIIAVALLALTASAQTDTGLTYAPLVRARTQYDQEVQRIQARYEADVKRARETYQRALTIIEASAVREANAAALREVEAEKKAVEVTREMVNPPADMNGTIWAQIHRGGRYWKVSFNDNGSAHVAGGNPATQEWRQVGGALSLSSVQYVWNGRVFLGTGSEEHRSLVPWPWPD
jgi:hypothetical protein